MGQPISGQPKGVAKVPVLVGHSLGNSYLLLYGAACFSRQPKGVAKVPVLGGHSLGDSYLLLSGAAYFGWQPKGVAKVLVLARIGVAALTSNTFVWQDIGTFL